MAQYLSNKAAPAALTSAGLVVIPTKTLAVGDTNVIATATITANMAVGDTMAMMTIPAGFYVLDMVLDVDKLDSGTTLMLEVGDATVPARFIAASNVGQAGGIVRMNVPGTVGLTYAADTQVLITATVGATGLAGSGNLSARLLVVYASDF